MKEIKFRQPRLTSAGKFIEWFYWGINLEEVGSFIGPHKLTVPSYQYIGLKDNSNPPREIYKDDIIEFNNGDRIVIKQEDWLKFYCDPIGEPECSDQWRDLYRVSQGKVIGNIYEHSFLLDK